MNRRTFITALAIAPFALRGGHASADHEVTSASRDFEVQGVTIPNSFYISLYALPTPQEALEAARYFIENRDDYAHRHYVEYETIPYTNPTPGFDVWHFTGEERVYDGTYTTWHRLRIVGQRGTLCCHLSYAWPSGPDDALMDDVIDTFAAWFEDLDGDRVYTTDTEVEKLLPTSADLPPFISIVEEDEGDD